MALIVETGAIVAGAESYCSVAEANAYHAARGNLAWDALDDTDQKEPALRKATDYLVQMYRQRWKGYRKNINQRLDWPRSYVYLEPFVYGGLGDFPYLVSDTSVPQEIKNACAELALRSTKKDLYADLTRAKSSVTVGPISVTYDPNSMESSRYGSVEAMLTPYLSNTSSMMARVVRR